MIIVVSPTLAAVSIWSAITAGFVYESRNFGERMPGFNYRDAIPMFGLGTYMERTPALDTPRRRIEMATLAGYNVAAMLIANYLF